MRVLRLDYFIMKVFGFVLKCKDQEKYRLKFLTFQMLFSLKKAVAIQQLDYISGKEARYLPVRL